MRLYNTLTRREDEFAPADGRTVRMYACGPTVYNRAHIGNFRTFVCCDVLRRTLKHQMGWDVRQVMNFTDVDDRTIAGSQKAGVPLREYTDGWIAAFLEDADALGLEPVEERPRATDEANLRAMAEIIGSLERAGHTYRSEGSTYYKISTFEQYGRLARLDHEGIKPGARVDADNYDKENARDFVLWKAARPGEPSWDLGFGPGRPGWHIECSAMALRLLGEPPIDLHAGGVDLVFPHHENEIAQSEGATGRPFARFWFHVEHLLIDKEKMSKSLGNFITIRDMLKNHDPETFRFFVLSTHYRSPIDFSKTTLEQAKNSIERIYKVIKTIDDAIESDIPETINNDNELNDKLTETKNQFIEAMDNDFNTPEALSIIFNYIRDVNRELDIDNISKSMLKTIKNFLIETGSILGVDFSGKVYTDDKSEDLLDVIVEVRNKLREKKDWELSDLIRSKLKELDIILEDK